MRHTIALANPSINQSHSRPSDPITQLGVGERLLQAILSRKQHRDVAILTARAGRECVLGVVQRRPGKPLRTWHLR
jgi:hypothetical protein